MSIWFRCDGPCGVLLNSAAYWQAEGWKNYDDNNGNNVHFCEACDPGQATSTNQKGQDATDV